MTSRLWLFTSAALIATSTLAWSAQDGAYDLAFGNGGRAWIDVTSSLYDRGDKLIRLPNGNLFMVGACGGVTCAAWLTPAGALASGYGTSGSGTAWFSAFSGWAATGEYGYHDAAAFQDGRVAVAVNSNTFRVAVLLANGSGLDPGVGNGAGYIEPTYQPQLVRITPQQQVIVVGWDGAYPAALVIARYDSTLHLDTTFGIGGKTTVGFDGLNTYAGGMTLQKDGKIVVITTVGDSIDEIGIVRLTTAGAPDPDFGVNSDGRLKSAFGNTTYGVEGLDITVDKQGRLVFVGQAFTSNIGTTGKWFVNRVLGGGAADSTFNSGQPQEFTIFGTTQSYHPKASRVAIQSDGRIVAVGTMDRPDAHYKYFAVARFLDNGTFDGTYGNGGQSFGDMSPQPDSFDDDPRSMVIVPGGILVGGTTAVTSGEQRFTVTKVSTDLLFASDFE